MGSPIDKETFLGRARARFGERYDYSGIVYKSYKTPIQIRCREHPVKVISITPEKHLSTTGGCKYCLRALRNQRQGEANVPPTGTDSPRPSPSGGEALPPLPFVLPPEPIRLPAPV
ncbi:MAG: hypothetical protein VKI81_00900 [Synechococcaceae cyanobacterium]|nr:hypothetical protein [Synechococcaceae cyanobacterium]